MKRRTIVKTIDVIIILTAAAGLLYQFGYITGERTFESLKLFSIINVLFTAVYYLCALVYLSFKERGVLMPIWKYSSFVTITFCSMIEWAFLSPFHANFAANEMTAMQLLHIALPLEVFAEWLFSEKGHFSKKYIPAGLLPSIVYGAVSLGAAALGHGFGVNGNIYPYDFLNAKLLGYHIVLGSCALFILCMLIYCEIVCAIDRSMYKRGRKR
jgi:hypothetical protein